MVRNDAYEQRVADIETGQRSAQRLTASGSEGLAARLYSISDFQESTLLRRMLHPATNASPETI